MVVRGELGQLCDGRLMATDHNFFFTVFILKKKIIHIVRQEPKQTFCIPKHLLKDG